MLRARDRSSPMRAIFYVRFDSVPNGPADRSPPRVFRGPAQENSIEIICSWEESNQTRILKISRYPSSGRAPAPVSLFRSCRPAFSLTPLSSYRWELRKMRQVGNWYTGAWAIDRGLNVAVSTANFRRSHVGRNGCSSRAETADDVARGKKNN